tara:strand:- start:215 stop:604 length:390 start_codon:yes stop_codon:yes gene_type:complete
MPPEYERGYADGYSDGFDEGVFKVEQDIAMKEGYSTARGMRYIQGNQTLPGRRRYNPQGNNPHAGISYETDVEYAGKLGPIKVKKRKRNKWVLFLKRFKFRKKKKNESGRKYLALRTKAAARMWKRTKK